MKDLPRTWQIILPKTRSSTWVKLLPRAQVNILPRTEEVPKQVWDSFKNPRKVPPRSWVCLGNLPRNTLCERGVKIFPKIRVSTWLTIVLRICVNNQGKSFSKNLSKDPIDTHSQNWASNLSKNSSISENLCETPSKDPKRETKWKSFWEPEQVTKWDSFCESSNKPIERHPRTWEIILPKTRSSTWVELLPRAQVNILPRTKEVPEQVWESF